MPNTTNSVIERRDNEVDPANLLPSEEKIIFKLLQPTNMLPLSRGGSKSSLLLMQSEKQRAGVKDNVEVEEEEEEEALICLLAT